MSATIVWFRRDLRLDDQPALQAAIDRGQPIVPVFLWSPEVEAPWQPGAASRSWLHHSLESLSNQLRTRGSRLILRQGCSQTLLDDLIKETGASAVYWNRLYDPTPRQRDEQVAGHLKKTGIDVRTFNGSLLLEPWDISTKQHNPYQVFTPFWNTALSTLRIPNEWTCPARINTPHRIQDLQSEPLASLKLLPRLGWDTGFYNCWTPGVPGAEAQLERFLETALSAYSDGRDRPDRTGTSRLSPHLHFGEISVWKIWRTITQRVSQAANSRKSSEFFLRELGWREFAHHLLHHFPETTHRPLRENFENFPWESDERLLGKWQRGETGYPIVDAGMRELWQTGWMHNRVRMIAASFLTKDLRISWQQGAAWFWETLVDADLANNTLGWQWTAGCGADAAPYFRVFNPTTQSRKFDPAGEYIRRYIPELRHLPIKSLHEPGRADASGYPPPMVEHREARELALAAFESIQKNR
ncbi:MAG TPA: deoxyribodipyrimidine photo-lyase [Planctomycetaceae bacterium]|nr:deoxyribodipyrimidine photo-lyase [Planctomycetaceae bacterium]